VIFFNNEQKLGEFTAAPYKMEYAPTSAQSMQIYALAVDKYGTIVRSDNTVNTEVKNQYDISTPVLTETTDGIEISLDAVQNTDTQEAMILVAALYDAQGNMTALKTSAFAQDNSAKVDFSKEQYDKSEKALVTVIRSLTDAKCYTSAFTINF